MTTIRIVPLILLLPFLGGCLFTGPMWDDANARHASGPDIEGILAPATGADGPALLVVRYTVHGTTDLYATIPMTWDGTPAAPFAYAGAARTPSKIAAALPESQRGTLREVRLTFHDERWAEHMRANPRFREVQWETDGESVPYDATYSDASAPTSACDRGTAEVRIRAVRLGRPWTDAERDAMPLPVDSPITYPADAWILVLPYALPRPAGQRFTAQLRAALLTPVTLLGDAVGVPYIFIMCYGFGLCP